MKISAIEDGVREYSLETWQEFLQVVADRFLIAPAYVYRGQIDYDWPIQSTLDRLQKKFPKRKNLGGGIPEYFETPPLSEDEHLAAFKRAIRGRRGKHARALTDDEYWALGQHHGLATPLLDWTRSPYVALFFAFEDEQRANKGQPLAEPLFRAVYALSTSTIEETPSRLTRKDQPADDGPKIISTVCDENYRLINQGGLFLKMPRMTDLENLVRMKFSGDRRRDILVKMKIPGTGRTECLTMLNKMNINRMSLFPDIDGAAKYVNTLWQPGHEDSIAYV